MFYNKNYEIVLPAEVTCLFAECRSRKDKTRFDRHQNSPLVGSA